MRESVADAGRPAEPFSRAGERAYCRGNKRRDGASTSPRAGPSQPQQEGAAGSSSSSTKEPKASLSAEASEALMAAEASRRRRKSLQEAEHAMTLQKGWTSQRDLRDSRPGKLPRASAAARRSGEESEGARERSRDSRSRGAPVAPEEQAAGASTPPPPTGAYDARPKQLSQYV